MEKHHRLINDPRIMGPLEEFLRTVREVVQFPQLKEDEIDGLSPDFVISRKEPRGFNRWW